MEKLKMALENARGKGKIAMFADGFVDEVWEIVASRASLDEYSLYVRMNQFAERITSSGSGGVGLELIAKRRVFGGFTANIGYAAARLGVDVSLVGVYGADKPDPCFEQMYEICNVHSVGDAAVTHVFEFDDGKILMSNMAPVQGLSWRAIVDRVGMDTIMDMLTSADILGVGYWSLLPAFDEIFVQICEHIPKDGKLRRFFFDFADFRKKDESSLKTSLALLKKYNNMFPMILSVNEHEGATLFEMCGESFDGVGRPIAEKADVVREQIGLDELVIHTPQFAAVAATGLKPAYMPAITIEKPVRTAGAGDTFNGGYITATLAKMSLPERLDVANAAVGHFLQTGVFPEIGSLLNCPIDRKGDH